MNGHPWSSDPVGQAAIRAAEPDRGPSLAHHEVPARVDKLGAELVARHIALAKVDRAIAVALEGVANRVARLEAIVGNANAGGEANNPPHPDSSTEPRGWLTAEEREAVVRAIEGLREASGRSNNANARTLVSLLAQSTPPKVKAPSQAFITLNGESMVEVRDRAWIDAIREAGVEVTS